MDKIKDKLFKIAPIFLKEVGTSLNSYINRRDKYGEIYHNELCLLRSCCKLNISEIQKVQEAKLSNFFLKIYKTNDYYKDIFNQLSINEEEIKTSPIKVLNRLPYMEKQYFKDNIDSISSSCLPTSFVSNTSGTSGSPMSVPFDSGGYQLGFAYWRRFYDEMGLPETFVNVRFSGRIIAGEGEKRRFWIYDYFESRYFFSTYHMTERNLKLYVDKLNKIKPDLIDGYPSSICILSRYILKNKISLDFKLKAIAVTAETLSDTDRAIIENAFNVKVYNQYASSEGAPFITECKDGGFHLNLDTGYFEFLDFKNDDNLKELVVTSFRNKKTPLIRYRIGDVVKPVSSNKVCKCGCEFPLIESIQGRADDILYSSERGAVGRLDPIYKGVYGIDFSQIIQIGIDDFVIKIVPNDSWGEGELVTLRNNFLQRMGLNVLVRIEVVDNIPVGANGKFKSVINKLNG
ncbi:phenylacetate--CoA ligase family protein [Vibrio alginolyticus]